MINMNVKVTDIPEVTLDLTKELEASTLVVAAEIRGSIMRGFTNATDSGEIGAKPEPIPPNRGKYAYQKMKTLGHADPLIGEERKLIDAASYVSKTVGMNHVVLTLSESMHPNSGGKSIAQVGADNSVKRGMIPARPFFGVSPAAVKRCVELITRAIIDKLNGTVVHG